MTTHIINPYHPKKHQPISPTTSHQPPPVINGSASGVSFGMAFGHSPHFAGAVARTRSPHDAVAASSSLGTGAVD